MRLRKLPARPEYLHLRKYYLMKQILAILLSGFFFSVAGAQSKISIPDSTKKILSAEASCGECQFKMEGKGCHLAVRMNGKTYFVDGTSIDDHGDAHGHDGFCESVRKAEVQGEVVNNRFRATYFKLLPVSKPKTAQR